MHRYIDGYMVGMSYSYVHIRLKVKSLKHRLLKMRISKMYVIRRKLLLSIQLAKDYSIQRKSMFSQIPGFRLEYLSFYLVVITFTQFRSKEIKKCLCFNAQA